MGAAACLIALCGLAGGFAHAQSAPGAAPGKVRPWVPYKPFKSHTRIPVRRQAGQLLLGTTYSQYSISSSVSGIKNMEAQTLNGISVHKIYFQTDVNLDLAIAQIVSATNAIRALMPAGIQAPTYNASSVPTRWTAIQEKLPWLAS